MQIRNSIFLVTGGASGLGAATAQMAAANGAKVVIADLQAEAGEKLAKEIGGKYCKCDVTSEADGKAAVRTIQGGSWIGRDWVVLGGLQAGDRVIVDNLVRLRPGATVEVTPAEEKAESRK